MKVIRYGQKIKTKETILILGGFGLIHNGHLQLLEKAKEAKKPISIMLIENPEFFAGKKKFQPLEDRLQDLANLGVSYAVIVKMDKILAARDGLTFLENIKVSINAKETISGEDFALGKNQSLKAKDIPDNTMVKTLKVNNNKISTSLLIEDVLLGKVKNVKRYSPYGYTTSVTINADGLVKDKDLIEKPSGIYAIWGTFNEIIYWGYTHVTTEGKEYVYLPQLKAKNQTLKIRIHYVHNIRRIFKSSEDTINETDKEMVMRYLSA